MRDDLDPSAPPMEFAGGRVSWSGYPSREARDAARLEKSRQAEIERERARRERDSARAKLIADMTHQAWQRIKAGVTYSRTDDRVYGFSCSVARDENRPAHGNVCVTEYADAPNVSRSVNVNGSHREEGPWRPDNDAIAREANRRLPA